MQSTVRSASSQTLKETSLEWKLLHNRIRNVIRPIVHEAWNRDFPDHSPIEVIHYVPGGFYKPHTDSGQRSHSRYLTIICYLNDDFEGGATHFPNSDFSVLPERGKAVVFPADYLHQAETVLDGEKYIALAWLVDSPPVSWI